MQHELFAQHIALTHQTPPATGPFIMNSLTILVIDDHKDAALTLSRMLDVLGHDAHIACDGRAGLEMARTLKPDVILLDIGMPDINGYEICQKLRTEPDFYRTRIIAQTGWGDSESLDRIRQSGFDSYLIKPFRLNDIEKLLGSQAA